MSDSAGLGARLDSSGQRPAGEGISSDHEGIRLVAGLGNPGKEYQGTRHNIGFAVLDYLAQKLGVSFSKESKWEAHVARIPNSECALLKPTTFMNLSGEAVADYAHFYRIPAAATLVVLDDVALPLGALRMRREGGSGGQNGLKSVLLHFGTQEVPRLRVGVGGAAEGRDLSSHVLSRFHSEEQSLVSESIARAAESVLCAMNQGLASAMNLYNATTSMTKTGDNNAKQP